MKKLSWKQIIGGVMAFLMVLTQAPVAALAVTDAPAPTAHASQYGSSVETPIYAKGREGSGSELLGKAQMETVVRFEIDPEVSVLVTQESEDPEAEPVTETVHPYHDWRVAFVVSFNRNVAKDSLGISTNCSYAANWGMNGWCGFLLPKDLQAGQELQLLGSGGQNLTYGELCAHIPSFLSGAFNLDEENIGVKATFKLKLYEKKDGSETGNTVTLASYSFAFSKAKNPFGDSQQEPAATEIPEEPGTSVSLVEETETDENGVPADNDLPGDVTEKNSEGTDDVTDEEPTKGSASDGELETDENDFETDSTGTDGGADSTGGNNAETDDETGDDSEGTVDGTEEEKPKGNTSNGEIATNENGSENDNTGIDGGADITAGNNGETNDETGDDSEGTVDETEEEKPKGAEDGGTEDEGELNNQSGDGTEGLTDEVDREPNRDNLTGSDSTWTIELTSRTENSTTTVARVSGGGNYPDGETVTVIAYPRNGYRFVGWYEQSDTSFSTILCHDQAYTFIAVEDRALMAVYTVASGASFTLTVYGSKFKINNGSQQTDIASQILTPGDRVFLSFIDTSKTFLYWVNKPGRILSTDKDYSFVMVGDTEIYAYYNQAAESTTTAFVIFRNASNQVLLSRSYTQNETIQYPEKIPSMMGYVFTGWYIADVNGVSSGIEATEENIWDAMENGNSVTVVPGYVSSGNTYTVIVTYVDESGTELQQGVSDTNIVGDKKVYTAPAQIGEKVFRYWKLNSEIVGYAQDYTLLRAMPGTVTLEACYGDTAGEPEALVTITQTYSKKKADGTYALSNTMQCFVPDEYEVAEAGFVYGIDTARFGGENGQDNLTIGKQGVIKHDSGHRSNRITYTLNYSATDPSTILYARAYVTYKDKTGLNVHTIYSDMTTCQYVYESGFLVVFQNWDGTVLQQSPVPNGETPVYTGETPTKAADAQYTYTFDKWTPEIAAVTGDATYTATYTSTVNEYTIKFVDENGTEISSASYAYGTAAADIVKPADPTKDATAEYTYAFDKWTPDVVAVTGDAEYTATFTATKNSYTITWKNDDGSVIDTTTVAYGETPTHEDPSKEGYAFAGWTPNIVAAAEDSTYTATWNPIVTFKANYEGSTADDVTQIVTNGTATALTAFTDTSVTPNTTMFTREDYAFTGWNTAADGTGTAYADGAEVTITAPLTLYAQWEQAAQMNTFTHSDNFANVDSYLYRVGNGNTVKLGSLFKCNGDGNDAVVSGNVIVEAYAADNNTSVSSQFSAKSPRSTTPAKYTYTKNDSDWTQATLRFTANCEGPVQVVIKEGDTGEEYILNLEVVNGNNATTATSATGANIVLLNDVSSGGLTISGNHTLYGNGFKVNDTRTDTSQAKGWITITNGIADNVYFNGQYYPSAVVSGTTNQYYQETVRVTGNSAIRNCVIIGGRYSLKIDSGSCVVDGITIIGGALGNLWISGGNNIVLRNVTTIQKGRSDNTPYGIGILVESDEPTVTLEGYLHQYNWGLKSDIPSTYSMVFNDLYSNSSYANIRYVSGGNTYINTGILFFNENKNLTGANLVDNRSASEKASLPYTTISKSFGGKTGKLYTVQGSVLSNPTLTNNDEPEQDQYTIDPVCTFAYPNDNSNERHYCVYNSDTNTINIGYESELTTGYTFDPNILTVTKFGKSLEVTVKLDGTVVTGGHVFNQEGNHVLTYSYTDPYNYDKDAAQYVSKEYTQEINISVVAVAPNAKNAEFTFYGYGSISKTASQTFSTTKVLTSTSSGKKFVMPDASAGTYLKSTTIDGVTVLCPVVYVDFKDNSSDFNWLYPLFLGVDIKDYADGGTGNQTTIITHNSTSTLPSGLTIITEDKPTSGWGWSSGSGKTGSKGKLTSGTYNGLYGWTSGAIGSDKNADTQYGQFSYKDNKGDTFYFVIAFYRAAHTCPSSCFAPGTLITLAGGSQKAIEEVTVEDQIMSWDFFAGEYVSQEISLLVDHGEAEHTVANMIFSDGTVLRTIADHGLFDIDLNRFVYPLPETCEQFIGHRFVKCEPESGGYSVVTMTDAYMTTEVTHAYSITAAYTSNAIAAGLLTVAPPEKFYNWVQMGDTLRYDTAWFASMLEQYGTYDYSVFADYVTEKQFDQWNGKYLKIAVESGKITFDEILELIDMYKQYMPE